MFPFQFDQPGYDPLHHFYADEFACALPLPATEVKHCRPRDSRPPPGCNSPAMTTAPRPRSCRT